MKKFKLELTEEQINYILNVVATRPFTECHLILSEIQKQAGSQVQQTTLEPVED